MKRKMLEAALLTLCLSFLAGCGKEPVQPEQLLEMDGSPVWIKSESVWGLVQAWDSSDIDVVYAKPRGNFKAVPAKTLELYLYPPEGEASD